MDRIQRIQQQRAREAAERNRLYADMTAKEAARVAARRRADEKDKARSVAFDAASLRRQAQAVPKAKPVPKPKAKSRAAGRDPAKLEALMQRILSEMSVPSQRKVLIRAQELVRTPEFRDVPAPTPDEVRAFLADNPRFQAKFPVPEFPGRNQYGNHPLEILGADLIEKDKTTRNVKGNLVDGELQTMILVVGDRFTRKVWATTLPGKSTPEVIAGFKKLWPDIIKDAGASRDETRATTKTDMGVRQLVADSATWATSAELAAWMKKRGVIVRNKNSADRAQLQNNSIRDSAIAKIQGFIQNRRVKADDTVDTVWIPYVQPAVAEYNRNSIQGLGMMNSTPNQAVKSKVIQFIM